MGEPGQDRKMADITWWFRRRAGGTASCAEFQPVAAAPSVTSYLGPLFPLMAVVSLASLLRDYAQGYGG